ncbi:MAG TPA: alpha/beta hydrolase [Candidatus Polarisedimenticolia bacterium]|nr:alpha/beta hydrolase [Candidatus Polarisedimenticolia bacterium]
MRSHLALHYVERGAEDAPAILFLHGITGSRRYWLRRVRSLADRYRLVLPDLIGFGLSPKPHVEYTVELFRDSVRRLVEELNLSDRPLSIVAHSLGSLVALEYAARYGSHLDRMVLFSLPRFNDPITAHAIFWKGSPHYRRLLDEHSLKETLAQMRRSGLEITARYLFRFPWTVLVDSHKFTFKSLTSTLEHCLLNYRVDRVLPSVPPIPILLVHGEQDSVAPLDHIRTLPSSYPFMRLETIRGTGHHLFLTHPRRSVALISDFIDAGQAMTGRQPATRAAAGLHANGGRLP